MTQVANAQKDSFTEAGLHRNEVAALRKRLGDVAPSARVTPHYINGTTRFWFEDRGAKESRTYYVVDPAVPTRKPAFDHTKLAKSLAAVLHKPVTATQLPVTSIAFPTNGGLLLRVADKTYRCDLTTYALTESIEAIATDGIAPRRLPRSENGGSNSRMTFDNHTSVPVRIVWVDGDGGRHPYDRIEPGQKKTQNTYAGHSWLVIRDSDKAPLIGFVAEEQPTVAVIDKDAPEREPRQREEAAPKYLVVFHDNNVFLRENGTDIPLTTDGTPANAYEGSASYSPDGTKCVVLQTEPAQKHPVTYVESSPRDQVQPIAHTMDYLKPGDKIEHPRVRLFDLATRKQIPVSDADYPNPFRLSDFAWSKDSSTFYFMYNQRGHQRMTVFRVDAATGDIKPAIDDRTKTFIDWTGKTYFEYLPETDEAIWMSERDGWCHLYLYDMRTGQVKNQVTKGDWVVRGVEKVDPMTRQIEFVAGGIFPGQDPYYQQYCRVGFDGANLVHLTDGDGNHRITYSPDRSLYFDTFSRVDNPPVTELHRTLDGKKLLTLRTAETSAWSAAGGKMPIRFVAKARDGKTDIYGIIHFPVNYDPSRKYPIVEQIYAGPQSAFTPKDFMAVPGGQTMALRQSGFFVVQMDGMGTSLRSKAFHDVCWKNLADAGFPDRILWIKAAAKQYPSMDTTRVGLIGTSAGGQNALGGVLLHGDFYKAAVADCGCHDNRMDKIWWNEQWMGYPVDKHYEEQSNVTLAPRLTGKLLLLVGEMDTNVDPASSTQVANALIKAGKNFDFYVVPGVGHGTVGVPFIEQRLLAFFRDALGTSKAMPKKPVAASKKMATAKR